MRPSFATMWSNFAAIYGDGSIANVGLKIGGKVGENIELGAKDPLAGFTNACAIRMSYTLNYSGIPITRAPIWSTVSGADDKWYIYRVRDLIAYLNHTFGKPDQALTKPQPEALKSVKGILVFDVSFSDASGHATLWDGSQCSDHCYFPMATRASLWQLK